MENEEQDAPQNFRMPGSIARRIRARIEVYVSQEMLQTPIIIDSESDASPPRAPIPDKCSNKPITMGRTIDSTFLENEGFDIGNKLIRMSWGFICSLNVPTYPKLVREFYNTL